MGRATEEVEEVLQALEEAGDVGIAAGAADTIMQTLEIVGYAKRIGDRWYATSRTADPYETGKAQTTAMKGDAKVKLILVYATRPEIKPLGFVRDSSDVETLVRDRLNRAIIYAKGRAEEIGAPPNAPVVSLSIRRWESARWTEVIVDTEAPDPGMWREDDR